MKIIQAGDHDNVASCSFEPAVEGNHAIGVVAVKDIESLTSECRLGTPQPDQVLHEPVEVHHCPVLAVIWYNPLDESTLFIEVASITNR